MEGESNSNDRQTVQEVLQGRTEAFSRLVEKYKRPVFNLTLRLTGSRQDAEDLAQETFLKAYVGLKRFDIQRRFFPWLFTIAVNTVRSHLKKTPPVRHVLSDAAAPDADVDPRFDPQRRLENKQRRQHIAVALQQLPVEQREAVVLRYFQELSFNDIATVCNVSLSTAKMRVYRGIQRLAFIWER